MAAPNSDIPPERFPHGVVVQIGFSKASLEAALLTGEAFPDGAGTVVYEMEFPEICMVLDHNYVSSSYSPLANVTLWPPLVAMEAPATKPWADPATTCPGPRLFRRANLPEASIILSLSLPLLALFCWICRRGPKKPASAPVQVQGCAGCGRGATTCCCSVPERAAPDYGLIASPSPSGDMQLRHNTGPNGRAPPASEQSAPGPPASRPELGAPGPPRRRQPRGDPGHQLVPAEEWHQWPTAHGERSVRVTVRVPLRA